MVTVVCSKIQYRMALEAKNDPMERKVMFAVGHTVGKERYKGGKSRKEKGELSCTCQTTAPD